MIVALSIDLHGISGAAQACMQFMESDDTDWPIELDGVYHGTRTSGCTVQHTRVHGPAHRVHVCVT